MIDPAIEQALAPSRKSWKDNIYQSKAFAFLTSSALAWTLLLLCLAGSYVLLKMPSLAPDDAPSTMTIEPIPQVTAKAPAQKRVKVATENVATKTINTPAIPSFETKKQPVKKPQIDDGFTTEFDRDLSKFESTMKKEFP